MATVRARAIGFAPHTRVAAESRGSTGGKIAQAAGVVEGRERAQTGEFRLVHMLQRAHGSAPSNSLRQTRASCRAVKVGVERYDAHAATGRLIKRRTALGASGIRWTKHVGLP